MTSSLVAVLLASRIGQDPLTALRAADTSAALTHFAIASLFVSVPLTLLYKRLGLQTSPSFSPPQRLSKRHCNSSQRRVSHANAMTPISSRKRPSPDDGPGLRDSATSLPRSPKRPRITTSSLPGPSQDAPMTPPLSAPGPSTMALKLIIPQKHPTVDQQRKLTRHRADAERWKPKLQRPYPRRGEIKTAYPLKLMRHYHNPHTVSQPNFNKPKIDTSPRVSRLLSQFPLLTTTSNTHPHSPVPLSTLRDEADDAKSSHPALQANYNATRSDNAQRLAWLAFSVPEEGRVDRGREAMIVSGLMTDDLEMEASGQRNGLPHWRKYCTGRFGEGRW